MADSFLISRDRLAAFLPDNDTLRRFEKLFQAVNIDTPANFAIIFQLLQELAVDLGTASSSAVAVNDALTTFERDVEAIISYSDSTYSFYRLYRLGSNTISGRTNRSHGMEHS